MKYLAKIIASDQEGLQMISTCSSAAKVKVSDIKYLISNKVFLLLIESSLLGYRKLMVPLSTSNQTGQVLYICL